MFVEKTKNKSTVIQNMRLMYREEMRAYTRVFCPMRKVKRGLQKGMKLELISQE